MSNNNPAKIHIIGSVGSGKTTLGKRLSANLNIVHYELDNVVWQRGDSGDIRRKAEERDACLHKITGSNAWIIEGVHYEWVHASFKKADLIILLDPPYAVRTIRIIKRFILQKLGIEQSNYKPTFAMFRKMFAWNRYYEEKSKPEILEILKAYEQKVVILKNSKDLGQIYKREA